MPDSRTCLRTDVSNRFDVHSDPHGYLSGDVSASASTHRCADTRAGDRNSDSLPDSGAAACAD